jgi:ceramide glucosyltransferase
MEVLALAALIAGSAAAARYVAGLFLLVRYLRRSRLRAIPAGPTPPLSLLKPLHGLEPDLESNLSASLRQNYPGFEVLFLSERADDPAGAVADAVVAEVPDVEVRRLSGLAAGSGNPKAILLSAGQVAARHEILVAADSDVRPDPLYLRDAANALANAEAVSFLPVLFGARGLWARAASLFWNTDGFLTLLLAGGKITNGATIGVRRATLERAGGFLGVATAGADDHALGRALRDAGARPALSRRPARVRAPEDPWRDQLAWVVRRLRVVSSGAPLGWFAFLPPALAPGLLLATALATPHGGAALAGLLALTAARGLVAVAVDLRFVWDRSLLGALPLLPLLWVAEPAGWLAGLCGRTFRWRGRRYRLHGGRATLMGS